jgi:hypothetical protein
MPAIKTAGLKVALFKSFGPVRADRPPMRMEELILSRMKIMNSESG